jgi:uncharacterized protein
MRIVSLLALLALTSPAAAASFDCSKASAPDEVAICGNSKLSALDVLVARAYGEAHKPGADGDTEDKAHALADARSFNARKTKCGADVACLMSAHVGVLEDLNVDGSSVQVPDWVAATDMTVGLPPEGKTMPAQEGHCSRSRITLIGGRLEGDTNFSSGSTVGFANGGLQVSYDKVPGIAASKLGDPVLICLTALPKHCPAGDDRGKNFTTTNLRTKQSWSESDSEHRCGGA